MALTRSVVNVQLTGGTDLARGCATSPFYNAYTDSKTAAAAPTNPYDHADDANAAALLQLFNLEGSGAEIAEVRIAYTGSAPSATVLKAFGFIAHTNQDRKNGKVRDNAGDWALLYNQGTAPVAAATITGPTTNADTDGTTLSTCSVYIDLTGAQKFFVWPSTATATSTTAWLEVRFFSRAGNR